MSCLLTLAQGEDIDRTKLKAPGCERDSFSQYLCAQVQDVFVGGGGGGWGWVGTIISALKVDC